MFVYSHEDGSMAQYSAAHNDHDHSPAFFTLIKNFNEGETSATVNMPNLDNGAVSESPDELSDTPSVAEYIMTSTEGMMLVETTVEDGEGKRSFMTMQDEETEEFDVGGTRYQVKTARHGNSLIIREILQNSSQFSANLNSYSIRSLSQLSAEL